MPEVPPPTPASAPPPPREGEVLDGAPKAKPTDAAGGAAPSGAAEEAPAPISKLRIGLAFAVAALADGLTLGTGWNPPGWVAEVGLDVAVALALWWILGRRWWLLIPLVLEAIPFAAMFPTWLAVMGVVAATGTLARRLPPSK